MNYRSMPPKRMANKRLNTELGKNRLIRLIDWLEEVLGKLYYRKHY